MSKRANAVLSSACTKGGSLGAAEDFPAPLRRLLPTDDAAPSPLLPSPPPSPSSALLAVCAAVSGLCRKRAAALMAARQT